MYPSPMGMSNVPWPYGEEQCALARWRRACTLARMAALTHEPLKHVISWNSLRVALSASPLICLGCCSIAHYTVLLLHHTLPYYTIPYCTRPCSNILHSIILCYSVDIVYINIYTYAHMYHMYVYMFVCIYIYIYVHITL